jgi:hypothetical protein
MFSWFPPRNPLNPIENVFLLPPMVPAKIVLGFLPAVLLPRPPPVLLRRHPHVLFPLFAEIARLLRVTGGTGPVDRMR